MATAREVQQRRGTTEEHEVFIGAAGELTVDTDKKTAVVHDGVTQGGTPLAKESDLVSTSSIVDTNKNDIENLDVRLTAAETNISNNKTTANDDSIAMSIALG